jgi:hypothetical protein
MVARDVEVRWPAAACELVMNGTSSYCCGAGGTGRGELGRQRGGPVESSHQDAATTTTSPHFDSTKGLWR